MEEDDLIPVPPDPFPQPDDCRLWVGNIDLKITEYTILKLLQKFGKLKRFDFIYHKSGPDKGKSRGYCFCSYESCQEAKIALKKLHGKLALSKRLIVKWAHVEPDVSVMKKTDVKNQISCNNTCDKSVNSQIKEIEAKLQTMEKTQKDFSISSKLEAAPGTSKLSAVNIVNNVKTQLKPYSKSDKYYKAHHRNR